MPSTLLGSLHPSTNRRHIAANDRVSNVGPNHWLVQALLASRAGLHRTLPANREKAAIVDLWKEVFTFMCLLFGGQPAMVLASPISFAGVFVQRYPRWGFQRETGRNYPFPGFPLRLPTGDLHSQFHVPFCREDLKHGRDPLLNGCLLGFPSFCFPDLSAKWPITIKFPKRSSTGDL